MLQLLVDVIYFIYNLESLNLNLKEDLPNLDETVWTKQSIKNYSYQSLSVFLLAL